MSLVAYGSSDESDEEQENEVSNEMTYKHETPIRNKENNENQYSTSSDASVKKPQDEEEVNTRTQSESKLFSSLPPPKAALSLEVEADTVSSSDPTKNKKTVKISIPSLSEFKDDDAEPATKKLKPSAKGSGLFALLPAPRNVFMNTSSANKESKPQAPLVPRILSKPPVKPAPVIPLKPMIAISSDDSADDPGHIEPQDFFSLGSLNETPAVGAGDLPELSSESGLDAVSEACHSSSLPREQSVELSNPESAVITEDTSASAENGDMPLSEEALQALCGHRATRRPQEVEVIDVDGALLLPDPKEWLIKQLTEERQIRSHGHRRHDGPTSQQRRKHQITYLAFQAKENELELKNQWSQNRMSRKQTQSKYGF